MSSIFANMKVSTRLALGFGATVALAVAVVAYAALTMQRLSDNVNELATNRMVKVAQFNQVKSNFQTIARRVRNIIIIDDDQARYAEEAADIAKLRAQNNDLLAQLDKRISLPKGRELFQTITDTRKIYNQALDRAIAFAMKNQNAQASAVLFDEAQPLQKILFKAVDDSTEMQQDLANELAQSAERTASFSVVLMGALAVLMAAIGSAVGWLLSRHLRTALGAEPSELSQAVALVADGDLSQAVRVDPQDTTSVMANVARMQASLVKVVSNVRSNSESVATASAQIAQGNSDLSQRTEEQASALEETAATMEQLGSTVRSNADSAKQANQMAQSASAVALQGGDVVSKVVTTMQDINESSRKVSEIIGVIDGIAFQTNILALNAAVEAARAGEQGRGFAVVATEVRTLAQRSADAAKEIKALIGRSVAQVESGTSLVDQAGKTMSEIVTSIQRVSDIVGEITASSVEQSSGVQQVGDAVGLMDQATQQNAALVEESAAAAESLKGQAQLLVQAVAVFKLSSGGHIASSPTPIQPVSRPAPSKVAVRPLSVERRVQLVKPDTPAPAALSQPAPKVRQAVEEVEGADSWETF
jgi:methyl-accepting chemotaxis protein